MTSPKNIPRRSSKKQAYTQESRLQNSLFFLSFFCRSVVVISMRDAGMCDARIKGSPTRREEKKQTVAFSYNEFVPT